MIDFKRREVLKNQLFNLFLVFSLMFCCTKLLAKNERPGEIQGQQMTFNSINEGYRIVIKKTSQQGVVTVQLLDVDFSGPKAHVLKEIARFKAKYNQTTFASDLQGYYFSSDKKSILTIFRGKNQVFGASLHIKNKVFTSFEEIYNNRTEFLFSSDLFVSRYTYENAKDSRNHLNKCLNAFI